jgi:hypothetical protein
MREGSVSTGCYPSGWLRIAPPRTSTCEVNRDTALLRRFIIWIGSLELFLPASGLRPLLGELCDPRVLFERALPIFWQPQKSVLDHSGKFPLRIGGRGLELYPNSAACVKGALH